MYETKLVDYNEDEIWKGTRHLIEQHLKNRQDERKARKEANGRLLLERLKAQYGGTLEHFGLH